MQLLFNGLISGSIYALVSCGFSMIYSTNKFMHFAHGMSIVISSYIIYTLFTLLGINFWVSTVMTLILAGLFGLLINNLIYAPLQKKNSSNVILLMASIGSLILFENIILLIFGPEIRSLGFIEITTGLNLLGAYITPLQIWIIIISGILFVLLHLLMKKTKIGQHMRAVSNNKELASIVGINHKRVSNYSFIIGSTLAGIAGVLFALEQNVRASIGTHIAIKGFTGAVIGGITSVPGSIIGSYLLGLAENFGIWFLPSGYKDAISFVLLFIFLLFKPDGLFGIKMGVKK